MTWTKPAYGKAKVDRAGHVLISKGATEEEKEEALTVLNNWRSSHGYPMNTFQARLRQVSKKVDDTALVVQRLNRVPSIRKSFMCVASHLKDTFVSYAHSMKTFIWIFFFGFL